MVFGCNGAGIWVFGVMEWCSNDVWLWLLKDEVVQKLGFGYMQFSYWVKGLCDMQPGLGRIKMHSANGF